MAREPNVFDLFFRAPIIQANGVELPQRSVINFLGGATDNPDEERTDVPIGSGGTGHTITNTGTGTLNNVATTAGGGAPASVIRLTGTSNATITGLAGGSESRELVIMSIPGDESVRFFIADEGSGSAPANRIRISNGGPLEIPNGGAIRLAYDSTTARWRVESVDTLMGLAASPGQVVRRNPAGDGWVAEDGVELPDGLIAGDIFYVDSSLNLQRIPIGTNGQVLTVVSGLPAWAAPTGGGSTLNPDTIAWNGSWGPAYTTSPWAGRESPTGASGSQSSTRSATATVNTPSAVSFNGLQAPNFNGTNTDLDPSGNLGDYINATTGVCSGILVFEANSAATDSSGASSYLNPPLLGENGGVWGVTFSSAGFAFFFNTATGTKRAVVACATGGRRIGLFRYDGTTLEVSVDGGATWGTDTATWSAATVSAGARTLYIGRGFSTNFNGPIADGRIRDTLVSRADLGAMAAYLATPYGVTF